MTTKNTTIASILVVVAVVCAAYFLGKPQTANLGAGDSSQSRISVIPTTASVTLTLGTSTLIVATNTARSALVISNNSVNTVFINIGAHAANGTGIRINASSTYEFDPLQMFTRAVYGYSVATSSVSYLQTTGN